MLSCPSGARGQKGPRGALVHPAGQRHRPPPPAQAADLQLESPATAGSSRVSWHRERCRCHPRPLELCPGLGGRTFAGVANVPQEGTGSRRPLGGSRRAAHTAPGGPRPPGRPDAPLVPRVRLGAGSRPGRARRPRHQTGGRELGRPPRAAAGEGALLSDSRGWAPGGPEGRSLLPGGLRNLVRLRLCGL